MITKIFEKYEQLKSVLKTYNDNGKKKEDEPTVIEAVKKIIGEFSEMLKDYKGEESEGSEKTEGEE